MKNIINLIIIIQLIGCFNKYGIVLKEEKTNIIPSVPHLDYKLNKQHTDQNIFPKSIIFIISDGTGIGQYSLSYYANGPFAPARFEHVGLVATHPNHGDCATTCKRVTDSAASGTALLLVRKRTMVLLALIEIPLRSRRCLNGRKKKAWQLDL